jgi:hypothetical protein
VHFYGLALTKSPNPTPSPISPDVETATPVFFSRMVKVLGADETP